MHMQWSVHETLHHIAVKMNGPRPMFLKSNARFRKSQCASIYLKVQNMQNDSNYCGKIHMYTEVRKHANSGQCLSVGWEEGKWD